MPPRRGVLQLTMPSWVHRSLRSEEHTSELQSQSNLVCRLLLEKKKQTTRLLTAPLTPPQLAAGPPSPLLRLSVRTHSSQAGWRVFAVFLAAIPAQSQCPPLRAT